MKEYYLDKFPEYRNASKGARSLHTGKVNIDEVLKFIFSVNEGNCKQWVPAPFYSSFKSYSLAF